MPRENGPRVGGVTSDDVDAYFEGRPRSREVFDVIADRIEALGPSQMTVASQISFGRRRKFAWFWLYNVTKKDPNGVPHLMLALDYPVDSERIRDVSRVGKSRWNHQIVVRSAEDAQSQWLEELLAEAYEYGAG